MKIIFDSPGESCPISQNTADKVVMGLTEGEQNRLIISHMNLVEPIAALYRDRKKIPFEDLLAQGRVGLVAAARNYRADLSKFKTFASFRIEGEIRDFIDRWKHLVSVDELSEKEKEFYLWGVGPGLFPYETWTKLDITPESLAELYADVDAQRAMILSAMIELGAKERAIVIARHFRDPQQPIHSIARDYDISYRHTCRILKKSLRIIREHIWARLP